MSEERMQSEAQRVAVEAGRGRWARRRQRTMRGVILGALLVLAGCSADRELYTPDEFHLGYGLWWGETDAHYGPSRDPDRVLGDADTESQAVGFGFTWNIGKPAESEAVRELRAIRAMLAQPECDRTTESGSSEIVQPERSCEADSEPTGSSARSWWLAWGWRAALGLVTVGVLVALLSFTAGLLRGR
ncbi:MAG TPA: hypothetical protein VF653_00960 [Methylomirabilota bacterium]